jgi:hypothetical protein
VDIWDKESRKRAYPLKNHPGATNKVNVYASEVFSRAHEVVPNLIEPINEMTRFHDGFSDDQLSSCIMYTVVLNPYFSDPARMATRMVRDPKGCKSISNAFKSLGFNCKELGAILCEAESLIGRGAERADAEEDAKYRTEEGVGGKLHTIDGEALRPHIRKIFERECGRDLEFEEPSEFWKSRWAWCVNGAHSTLIERKHPELIGNLPPIKGRAQHRRVFAERVEWEPVTGWDGKSYYTFSLKLECGKTRTIYSGDSLTYFAFEHLMKPVEQSWKNRRSILNPGGLGTWKVGKRIRKMRVKGPVHVMLDYDDFNARHRLEYFRIVLEELALHTGYDPKLLEKLIASVYDGEIFVDGESIGKVLGTLMSGHRCTTFFNTILNEAYIRHCYPDLDNLQSMHVGDDVYISAPSYEVAQDILARCAREGLAMNPLKQSVGVYCAEFLRVAYGESCARGYVTRSISSCVNGNWASEVKLNAEEGLRSVIGHAWTLCNRAYNPAIGTLLVSSVKRLCRISSTHARNLLTGAAGLADGPTRAVGHNITSYDVKCDMKAEEDEVALASQGLGEHATIDFLTYCATPLEQMVLGQIGGEIKDIMRCASYKKTMISGGLDHAVEAAVTKVTVTRKQVRTTVMMEQAGWRTERDAYLAEYPLLQLVKNRMTEEMLAQCLMAVGAPEFYGPNADRYAWGKRATALAVFGTLTYSDACSLCSRADEDMVYVAYSCYA